VTTAADGAEATACFAKHASEIQLVVLDFHMPNLSGSVLAKVLSTSIPRAHADGQRSRVGRRESSADPVRTVRRRFSAQALQARGAPAQGRGTCSKSASRRTLETGGGKLERDASSRFSVTRYLGLKIKKARSKRIGLEKIDGRKTPPGSSYKVFFRSFAIIK